MAMFPPSESQLGIDEERSLLSQEIPTKGNSYSLPTHVQHGDLEDVGSKPEPDNFMISASRTAWQRFNGHGRRRVGFFHSLKAVILSSCAFILIVVAFLGTHSGPQT